MRSLVTLAVVFAAALGGLVVLDREDKLPELYTGAPVARAAKPPPPRWYVVEEPFAVTTRGGQTARFTIALQLPKRLPDMVRTGDRAGRLEQEPVVRAIVTDTVMGPAGRSLGSGSGRRSVERLLRRRIRAHTDVRVRRVIVTVGG